VLGRANLVEAMRRNPLARALRVDKLTLGALHATLQLYREPGRAVRDIPALAMLTAPLDALHARATLLAHQLADAGVGVRLVDSVATVGGGAFPTATIPSIALALEGNAAAWDQALRDGATPVVGRIADGELRLDLRSIAPTEDARLLAAIREADA